MYIDTCCFIDLAKYMVDEVVRSEREQEVAYVKMILEAMRAGEIEGYTSTLTIVECLHVNGEITEEGKSVFKSLLTSGQYVTLISPTPFIAEAARDLRWVDGIVIPGNGADYLHVASALEVRCRELLTFDGEKKRRGILDVAGAIALKGLAVRKPSETTSLTDARRQMSLIPPPTSLDEARAKRSTKRDK